MIKFETANGGLRIATERSDPSKREPGSIMVTTFHDDPHGKGRVGYQVAISPWEARTLILVLQSAILECDGKGA